jgi:hypothetical protein
MPNPKRKPPVDLGSLARSYTEVSIRQLGAIAANSDSDSARCTAIGMLLERGWGKPAQPITGADGGELRITIRTIIEEHRREPVTVTGRESATLTVIPKRVNGGHSDGSGS